MGLTIMKEEIPPIYFYLPQSLCSKIELPKNPVHYWDWMISQNLKNLGSFSWTLLTYLHLQQDNFPCYFTHNLPKQGIVISHRALLPDNLKPTPRRLIVALQSDRGRHPYAQLHVVQNRRQEVTQKPFSLWPSFFLPHWTQPNIRSRNPERKDKFENIAFFGEKHNLIPELRQSLWEETLRELGLNWQIITPIHWHDYSQVDVVVAIRKFGYSWDHTWKPATKLYNSWLAGVPAILGCESAYQAERQSELDYLEVSSFDSLVSTIKLLKDDLRLREKIFKNSQVRAKEVEPKNTVSKWYNFLTTIAIPQYLHWISMADTERQDFFRLRTLAYPFYKKQRELRFFNAKLTNIFTPQNFVGQTRKYL